MATKQLGLTIVSKSFGQKPKRIPSESQTKNCGVLFRRKPNLSMKFFILEVRNALLTSVKNWSPNARTLLKFQLLEKKLKSLLDTLNVLLTTVLEYSRKSVIAFRSQSETVLKYSVFRTSILLQICFLEIRIGDLKHLCKISCQFTRKISLKVRESF